MWVFVGLESRVNLGERERSHERNRFVKNSFKRRTFGDYYPKMAFFFVNYT